MSEELEPWSHPWHALQHTLAKAFWADAPAVARVGARPRVGGGLHASDAPNWLVRARGADIASIPALR